MFFVIHPNQYLPETGYLLCGEPVLITANGSEVLSERTGVAGRDSALMDRKDCGSEPVGLTT